MKVWLPTVQAGSGSDVFVRRLADGLQATGHEAVIEWFPHRYELMPWRLRTAAAPPSTDIIQSNTWQGFAFKRHGIPLVVTEHHYIRHPEFVPLRTPLQALYHDQFIRRCFDRTLAAADAVVAVSANTANAVERVTGRRARVIHNWVDAERFRPRQDRQGMAHSPFRILFVGNPSKRKGSDLLPRFAEALGKDFQLRCLGGLRTDMPVAMPNLIRLPRVSPDEMPALYAETDAVVILARYEAFGYVALEAMASGIPVLGFDNTGTAEICPPEAAMLVPTGDLDALIECARVLATDRNRRIEMANAGRRTAVLDFGERDRVGDYLHLYEELCRSDVAAPSA